MKSQYFRRSWNSAIWCLRCSYGIVLASTQDRNNIKPALCSFQAIPIDTERQKRNKGGAKFLLEGFFRFVNWEKAYTIFGYLALCLELPFSVLGIALVMKIIKKRPVIHQSKIKSGVIISFVEGLNLHRHHFCPQLCFDKILSYCVIVSHLHLLLGREII